MATTKRINPAKAKREMIALIPRIAKFIAEAGLANTTADNTEPTTPVKIR